MGLVVAPSLTITAARSWALAVCLLAAAMASAVYSAGIASAQDGAEESAPEDFRVEFVGRNSLIIAWQGVPGYDAPSDRYSVQLTGQTDGKIVHPQEAVSGSNLAAAARRATFVGLDCASVYTVAFSTSGLASTASGYISETSTVTTAPCGASIPELTHTDNPFLMRYCGRLPGCPLTAVVLTGIGVAVVLISFTRSALIAAGGAVAGMALITAVLDPSNPFLIIFILAVAAGGVVVWRVMR